MLMETSLGLTLELNRKNLRTTDLYLTDLELKAMVKAIAARTGEEPQAVTDRLYKCRELRPVVGKNQISHLRIRLADDLRRRIILAYVQDGCRGSFEDKIKQHLLAVAREVTDTDRKKPHLRVVK